MENGKIEMKIAAILDDDNKTKDEKISELQALHDDERAVQRAVTEGGMVGDHGEDTSLREIELALQKLGVDPDGPEDTKAATL